MSAETAFKIGFAFAFTIAATIAARTARAAARAHGGSLNQLAHEVRALIWIRAALGIVFYAALLGWLFATQRARWMYVDLPGVVRWGALIAFVPVLVVFRRSFRALGINYRGGVGLYDEHKLVVQGPYAMVRHPIYGAFIAIMILVFLLSANWVIGASGLLLVSSIAAVRIPQEERELSARFGVAWTDYARRTGAMVPRLGVWLSAR